MAVQWDAAMVYTPGKTGFTAAGATGKGHPEAAQFICGDHNSSHHFEVKLLFIVSSYHPLLFRVFCIVNVADPGRDFQFW